MISSLERSEMFRKRLAETPEVKLAVGFPLMVRSSPDSGERTKREVHSIPLWYPPEKKP